MRLSQIKLAGFKSFVDPVHIHLPGQIAGIVGPNGCGKSNVIDALRWVLGESRASALRGASMQDVIFNGSGTRKPVARASVELVFDNSLGKAAGQWSAYAEISIRRVLLRNGESSYHINNQKVRRRDITDIFLGTGLGARAYAIVEQGMISRIIEARPDELRVFLEEAAGVSRYRDRRRETAQRLADTRDNLQRVGDILQEMDKQLARLGEQAEVARQYREFEMLRNTAQQLIWLVKMQEACEARAGFNRQIEKTRTEIEAQTAALRENESLLQTQQSCHYQLLDALHARQEALYSANADIARLEAQIKQATLQQTRLNQQIDSTSLQIGQQRELHHQATSQLAHWQAQMADAEINLAGAEQRALAETKNLPQAELSAQAARAGYNHLQREQSQIKQQLQLEQSQHDHLQRNVAQLHSRLSRLSHEQESLPPPDPCALQEAQEALLMLDMEHAELQEKLSALQAMRPQAEQSLQQLRGSLQQQERQAANVEARRYALEQLQQDSDKPLHQWLQQHGLDKSPRLWQSIRIRVDWENALDAVLREKLNALLVPSDAANWVDLPPGRLALFSYAAVPHSPRERASRGLPSELSPGLRPLLDYVECQDERVLPVLREFLSSVYAVSNLPDGYRLRERLSDGELCVTPEGHLIARHSVLFHAPNAHGVLSRQREIEQLDDELMIHQASVDQLKSQLAEAEQTRQTMELNIQPLGRMISELKLRQHAQQMSILKLDQAHERREERRALISHEKQEIAQLLETEQEMQREIIGRMAGLPGQLAIMRAQVEEAGRLAETADAALREQRLLDGQARHSYQAAQFFSRTCQEKISDFGENIRRIALVLQQYEQNLQQLRADLSDRSGEADAQALQNALQTRHAAELALTDARCSMEAAAGSLQSLEQARLSCEQKLGHLRENLNEYALKEQEARLYFEQWSGHLQGVDVAALQPHLTGAKPVQLQVEYNRLDKLMTGLGAVNLAALEELRDATERKFYLDAQAQDLQDALLTLDSAIKHIDRESGDLLRDTFNQVNLQLAELFPILFAGGEARLVMTGDEILDSGVQVMAQPPGKKNSSIHLLSGGEKALTAIALIFAMFRLNPAPFCLLDEVDAPLDDTNTERLCALVKKMALQTQFVFISHNKIAMEMAEQLIGVTMQEKGVSKIVSVDIEAALRMHDTPV